jgi:hypothetical protein
MLPQSSYERPEVDVPIHMRVARSGWQLFCQEEREKSEDTLTFGVLSTAWNRLSDELKEEYKIRSREKKHVKEASMEH